MTLCGNRVVALIVGHAIMRGPCAPQSPDVSASQARQPGSRTIMASAAGAVRTYLGNYDIAFFAGGMIAMIAAACALNIKPKMKDAAPPPVGAQPAGA